VFLNQALMLLHKNQHQETLFKENAFDAVMFLVVVVCVGPTS
jgi:hypothetical protein